MASQNLAYATVPPWKASQSRFVKIEHGAAGEMDGALARMAESNIRRATFAAMAAVALILMLPDAAFAHSGTKDEQEACTPDVFRLCAAQIPDETRIVACLNKNVSKLSPACRAVMTGVPLKSKSRQKD